MSEHASQLRRWLEQAYTMEKESEALLGTLADHLAEHPSLRASIDLHREQTIWQLHKIEDCLHLAGGTVPLIKSAAVAAVFNLHATVSFAWDDDISRALALTQAFEQWEMSNYKALIICANSLDEVRIADVCQEILKQEREMATWLSRQHEKMVTAYSTPSGTT